MSGRAIAACSMLLMICCPVAHAGAHPALDLGTLARVTAAWPDIAAAADLAEVEPEVLAALLVSESRLLPGLLSPEGAEGLGQIRWAVWGPLLVGEGLDRGDLDSAVWGVLAVGYVLAALRADWRPGSVALLVCYYTDGVAAARYLRDCLGSRAVLGVARGLHRGGDAWATVAQR